MGHVECNIVLCYYVKRSTDKEHISEVREKVEIKLIIVVNCNWYLGGKHNGNFPIQRRNSDK